jgi:hypothetical protein
MFKKLILGTTAFLFISFFSAYYDVEALTFDTLPIVQKSSQWSVQVGVAEKGKDLGKPVKGKFNMYSLKIDKIGKDVDAVYISSYRNEPNSIRKYGLHGCSPDWDDCNKNIYENAVALAKSFNNGASYQHANLPIAEKATELEVEIIWTEEGRPLKETFIFKNK